MYSICIYIYIYARLWLGEQCIIYFRANRTGIDWYVSNHGSAYWRYACVYAAYIYIYTYMYTYAYIFYEESCVTEIIVRIMCDRNEFYVRQDAFARGTWIIRVCDIHIYVGDMWHTVRDVHTCNTRIISHTVCCLCVYHEQYHTQFVTYTHATAKFSFYDTYTIHVYAIWMSSSSIDE